MIESETNQGLAYDGYTATAQYDTSFLPGPNDGDEKRPAKATKPDTGDDCDPPTVVDRKP